jgi:hypothetical protein
MRKSYSASSVCNGPFSAKRSHAKVCGNRQVRLHRRKLAEEHDDLLRQLAPPDREGSRRGLLRRLNLE